MTLRVLALLAAGLLLGTTAAQEGKKDDSKKADDKKEAKKVEGAKEAKKEDVEKELARFQGSWRLIRYEAADKQAPPKDVLMRTRFTFTGNRLTVTQDDKNVDESTFKVDPSKAPRAINIYPTKGQSKDKVSEGIYVFDGDTLKICAAAPGQKRPAEFKSDPGSRTGVLVLERQKP
jgi:uncharacterized protein (TIGR03067 family)